MFLIGAPFITPKASAADLNIRDFVNLLVAIGVISPDKMPAVNAFLATLDSSVSTGSSGVVNNSNQPSITILSPNGGESYKNDGSPITVNWQTNNISPLQKFNVIRFRSTCPGNASGCVAGVEYNLAYDVINDGQQIVYPSHIPDGAYTLEIKGEVTTVSGQITVMDSSNSYFKIYNQVVQPPTITILSPNGGEAFKNDGSPITVNWETNNIASNQKLDFIRLRDYLTGEEYYLARDVLNDGQEIITPTGLPADPYILEIKGTVVTSAGVTTVMDSSDRYFKIYSLEQTTVSVPDNSNNVNLDVTSAPVQPVPVVNLSGNWSCRVNSGEAAGMTYTVSFDQSGNAVKGNSSGGYTISGSIQNHDFMNKWVKSGASLSEKGILSSDGNSYTSKWTNSYSHSGEDSCQRN